MWKFLLGDQRIDDAIWLEYAVCEAKHEKHPNFQTPEEKALVKDRALAIQIQIDYNRLIHFQNTRDEYIDSLVDQRNFGCHLSYDIGRLSRGNLDIPTNTGLYDIVQDIDTNEVTLYNHRTRAKLDKSTTNFDEEQFNKDINSIDNSDTDMEADSDETLSDIEEDELDYFSAEEAEEDIESVNDTGIPMPPNTPIL